MTSPEVAELSRLDEADIADILAGLPQHKATGLKRDFPEWAHDGQSEPPGPWRRWVIMAGRGFGKTRAGAEWVADQARGQPKLRIALVAATREEARNIMIEGESGLLAVAGNEVARWKPSLHWLKFASGAEAALFSGANPNKLRGFQHHIAWCDELSKWQHANETWNMLQLGLRLGERPRALITTTPKPGIALEAIMALDGTVTTTGPTRANIHLSEEYLDTVHGMYRGTRLEKQELEGELLPDVSVALWPPEVIERCRLVSLLPLACGESTSPARGEVGSRPLPLREREGPAPQAWEGEGLIYTKTLIGVDPPSGDGTCGIIACGLTAEGIAHIIGDHSVSQRSPEGWANAVARAATIHGLGGLPAPIVAEKNQGGKMVESVLRAAGARLKVKLVNASEGKAARADPVSTLFEGGKVKFAGDFPLLEAELRGFRSGRGYEPGSWSSVGGGGTSPDRADAMVWALTELMLGKDKPEPRMRRL